ncbi:MAG: DNA polymerase III subunit delta' [Anaerolineae bacterium]|nr:DNA polymerase III subunit delta' [Anaerolineae bacterium]
MANSGTASWPVIGHEWAISHLERAIRHDRMRHAYLITGPDQIGKTTLARTFASALNCTGDSPPCGECRACKLIAKNSHPDVTIVEGENSGTLKIEQVRTLQQTLALRPYEVHYRVAILRQFHNANPAAANALLKTLEEPPSRVVLILTARSSDTLLPTIVSRCQPIHLRPLPIETVREALEWHWNADQVQAKTLAQLSGGRIGWAIRAIENPGELEQRDEALDVLEKLLLGKRLDRFAIAEKLATDKPALITLLEVWMSYWRDVTLVANGSRAPITNYDRLAGIQDLAKLAGAERAEHALHATGNTLGSLGRNVNTRLALEVLMLDYPAL